MGRRFFDKFSFLHFSMGVILNYFDINLVISIILHTIFEYSENTFGRAYINEFSNWPGGKPKPDNLLNIFGDTVFFTIGWLTASLVRKYVN